MMISSLIIYLELFIALFFLPGFFIIVILGIKKFRFLLSFALSYSFLVLTLLPFEYYAQPISRWQWCVLLEWVILAALAVIKTFMYRKFNIVRVMGGTARRRPDRRATCPPSPLNLIRVFFNPRLIIPLALAGVICGYLAYAGPYLEIPSDAWTHVYRFQWHKLNIINNGVFPSDLSWDSLLLHNTSNCWHFNPWYFIHAWLCNISGLTVMTSLHVLTHVNVIIFLLGFYFFGLFLFARLRINALKKMMMAAFASLFVAATMGNMVFAYIRYYAFAPTILSYVLFLAAMVFILVWMRSNKWLGHAFWMAPVFLIVTSMIHTQETLFIFFMTLALGIVGTVRILLRKSADFHKHRTPLLRLQPTSPKQSPWLRRLNDYAGQVVRGNNRWSVREWKSVILTASLILVFFAGFAAVRYFKPGAWISSNMIMPHVSIPPEPVNFIFRNLMISPPENPFLRLAAYQLFVFYQIVGCWGLFVYLLFALMIRRFVKIPYLIAGMIIVPFLTVFNPLTIDLIVRVKQGAALYRFIYMIPLPFVGGYLFIHFWEKAREWFREVRKAGTDSCPRRGRFGWICLCVNVLIIAGLIGLILPINGAGIYAPYSKIYTLQKIPAGNDYRLWNDLGMFIEKYENKVILMDGLTRLMGYYSLKNNCTCSEWLNSRNPEKDPPEPYTWESLRGRGMIIINRRDGVPSLTGKIAQHWPEDVLKVSRYYSLEAQTYLESHPEKFHKIWSQNRIAVYDVR